MSRRKAKPPEKVVRCAIYTRKSVARGLEQEFNSLDAQRDACAQYIQSQKAAGWRALPESYDDGGFTGANLERPGFQRLLEDVDAGRIDVVVVYKVDRLSRSLLDFARVMERLDKAGTSGQAVAETKAINKSLSALGDVICALASRAKHKPFRNSKLTHLLANSLSGSSKTLMFVNVAPGSKHYSETVSALRFAAKVNDCVPGK